MQQSWVLLKLNQKFRSLSNINPITKSHLQFLIMGHSKSKHKKQILQNPHPQFVKGIDIFRFLGKWYPVVGTPSFYTKFQNICGNYSLNFDGTLKLQTSFTKWGVKFRRQFTAQSTNPQNTRLKLNLPLKLSQIFIIVMIGEDYQYFVVSDEDYEELYIGYREPQMPVQIYEQILGKLKQNKSFKIDKLVKMVQKRKK